MHIQISPRIFKVFKLEIKLTILELIFSFTLVNISPYEVVEFVSLETILNFIILTKSAKKVTWYETIIDTYKKLKKVKQPFIKRKEN